MTTDEEQQERLATYHVGQMFRLFSSSDIGRYLTGRAEQDELERLRELRDTPAHDRDKIAQLQLEAKAPRLFLRWVEEAIEAGERAKIEFDHFFDLGRE